MILGNVLHGIALTCETENNCKEVFLLRDKMGCRSVVFT